MKKMNQISLPEVRNYFIQTSSFKRARRELTSVHCKFGDEALNRGKAGGCAVAIPITVSALAITIPWVCYRRPYHHLITGLNVVAPCTALASLYVVDLTMSCNSIQFNSGQKIKNDSSKKKKKP